MGRTNNFEIAGVQKAVAAHFGTTDYSYYIETFGCQQNVSDSEFIKGALESIGFKQSSYKTKANVVIFNSCAVRESAEVKFFGKLGELKAAKLFDKKKIIILCGCMFSNEKNVESIKRSYNFVDIVADSTFPESVLETLYSFLQASGAERIMNDNFDVKKEIIEGLPISRDDEFEVSVPIMYGCNNKCSYCIVPFARGEEVSRQPQDIVQQVTELVNNGATHITLLGQNVNSYGSNLSQDINFLELLKQICDVEGEFVVDFLSSHPKFFSNELIDFIGSNDKMSNFIHLPVQSGSDEILERMGRGYTSHDYRRLVNYAKKNYPGIAFSSDIIVGFPDETEEDFIKTNDLINDLVFYQLFTFIYSKRSGTAAASFPDSVIREKKTERMNRLLAAQRIKSSEEFSRFHGRSVKVVVQPEKDDNVYTGKAGNFLIVKFTAPKDTDIKVGELHNIYISSSTTTYLTGELEENR